MRITHCRRAVGLGFLSWLLPFAFGFLIYPLKQQNAPLFDTLMSLALVAVAGFLAHRYFRDTPRVRIGEAAALGLLWVVVNLVLDYPMFAYGPMQMTAARYYSEIGTAYLLYPACLAGGSWAFARA